MACFRSFSRHSRLWLQDKLRQTVFRAERSAIDGQKVAYTRERHPLKFLPVTDIDAHHEKPVHCHNTETKRQETQKTQVPSKP
jgi:hypothetical protein